MNDELVLVLKKRWGEAKPHDPSDLQEPYCGERQQGYTCTRKKGHTGPHRARGTSGTLVTPPWKTP